MTGRSPGVRIERLRAAVSSRVAVTSLRAVAREIGMSAPGLNAFLDGGHPRSATRRKLATWFIQFGAARTQGIDVDAAGTALSLLLDDLPPESRPQAVGGAVEFFERLYDEALAPRPGWLAAIRAEIGPIT